MSKLVYIFYIEMHSIYSLFGKFGGKYSIKKNVSGSLLWLP